MFFCPRWSQLRPGISALYDHQSGQCSGRLNYTLQHGFENVGLSYCDEIQGPDIKFAAKTVFTWGPTEELPPWVEKETRDKSVAVGCPKKCVIFENAPSNVAGSCWLDCPAWRM